MSEEKRINKSKEQIAAEMIQHQDTERKRALVRDVLFPLLLELNTDVRYAKIFLYTASVAVEQVYNEGKTKTTIGDLTERLKELFKTTTEADADKSNEYFRLFSLLKDESVTSFTSIVKDLPDKIDGYYFSKGEKNKVSDINIDEILG